MQTRAPSIWPLLIGTGSFLGLAIPVSKLAAQQGLGALDFALWPTVLAVVVLTLHAARRHGLPPHWRILLRFGVIAGVLGHALPMSLVFYLSAHAGAGFAALAFTLPPVFTLGIGLLAGLEAWRVGRLIAVGVGMAGAVMLVWTRLQGSDLGAAGLSTVLLLLAVPTAIGAGNVYRGRFLPVGVPNEWLGAATLLGSVLVLLPLRAMVDLSLPAPTVAVLGALSTQALAMVLGYVLYFRLQRVAEPVSFSFMGYVITLTGVLLGAVMFGEALEWRLLPALALVMLGFWLIRRSQPVPANAAT